MPDNNKLLKTLCKRLNHIAVAVPDVRAAAAIYKDAMGAEISEPTPVPNHGVTTIFVRMPGAAIELLEPLGENSPIEKFLQKNPRGGIHHLCYEVDDIHAAREHTLSLYSLYSNRNMRNEGVKHERMSQ